VATYSNHHPAMVTSNDEGSTEKALQEGFYKVIIYVPRRAGVGFILVFCISVFSFIFEAEAPYFEFLSNDRGNLGVADERQSCRHQRAFVLDSLWKFDGLLYCDFHYLPVPGIRRSLHNQLHPRRCSCHSLFGLPGLP
jgi:hypothetical protein